MSTRAIASKPDDSDPLVTSERIATNELRVFLEEIDEKFNGFLLSRLVPPPYDTEDDLPDADTGQQGGVALAVIISYDGGDSRLVYSNGTEWRFSDTNAVVT